MTLETGAHYPLRLDSLPPGWRTGYVGEFAKEIEPGFASGEHNQSGSGVPHLRPMNVSRDGKIDLSVLKFVAADKDDRRLTRDDVLFNNTNSPELVGKTAVVNQSGDFAFSNHMTRIRFGEGVLPKFGALQLHLLWMRGYFRYNCVKHVNQASVSSKTLARTVPFIWAPVDQQERIVAEIEKQFSRLDEAVANLKRVKANLKRYKAAILKAAVEGRLVPTEAELARREGRSYEAGAQLLQRILEARHSQRKGKGKYKEPVEPDTTDLPELPQRWVWSTFDQVTERVTKGSSPNWQGFSYCDDGIPFVRSHNVGWGETDLSDLAFLPPAFNEIEKKAVLKEGDLLLNIVGASIGRAAIAPKSVEGGNVNQAVAVIRLLASVLRKQYVLIHLLSATSQRRIHSEKVDVARANFSLEDIRAMPLALPPLAEQDRIVGEVDSRLSVVREVEAQADANLKRAQALRLAMLQQAFGPTCRSSQGKPLHAY